jgi:hypothetical protein
MVFANTQSAGAPSSASHRPDVPPALERVVSTALAVQVDHRYQSALELETALMGLGLATAIPMAVSTTPAERRPHRTSRLAWLAAAVLIPIVAGLWYAGSMRTNQVTGTTATTVAVLPFADQSPAGDQEYFSTGSPKNSSTASGNWRVSALRHERLRSPSRAAARIFAPSRSSLASPW